MDLSIKVDSYVLESNIHFPTDLNLLWDSTRKVLDTVRAIQKSGIILEGFRKHHYLLKQLKKCYRKASEIHRKKGKHYQERLEAATAIYLKQANVLSDKATSAINSLMALVVLGELSPKQIGLLEALRNYAKYVDKFTDLTERRIMKGEKIAHEEKVFSIFEPHVEWCVKGKANKKVELGHPLCIATDQYQFIVDYEVMFSSSDPAAGMSIGKRLAQKYPDEQLNSISFDRGFYSQPLKKELLQHFDQVIMPKRGKKSTAQQLEESEEVFQNLKRAHSAVEANINQLEHTGLSKCPDKGEQGFRRYAALGILAYNLHQLGKLLLEQERAKQKE